MTGKVPAGISIVVPLFNHLAATQAMLASLHPSLGDAGDYEVILVDDGSTDGTREWLDTIRDPRVMVVKNERNLGFAGATNRGVQAARGDIVVFANNDLVFTQPWLQPMLDLLRDPGREAGVVGNLQRAVADGQVDHAGIDIDFDAHLSHIRTIDPRDEAAGWREAFAVTGACCALRRSLFDRLGGLDESYRNGAEDVDLCFRAADLGLRNYVSLRSVVMHHVSLSRPVSSRQDEANSERLFTRWHDKLESRLADRCAQWLAQVPVQEPCSGLERLAGVHAETREVRDVALLAARSLLQRNAFHRRRALGLEVAEPAMPPASLEGRIARAEPPGYVHMQTPLRLHLAPGAAIDGLHVCGHFYASPRHRDSQAWLSIDVNDAQHARERLTGGDFTVSIERPLVTREEAAVASIRLLCGDADAADAPNAPGWPWDDVYLKHIVMNHVEVAFERLPSASRVRPQ